MNDIRWEPVRVRLRDLKPWERNPRQMSKRAAERLLQSWREYGQVQTVAVGPDGEVYDGHQRLSALLSVYGPDYEILALRASRPLTEQERERLVLLLHAGAMGEWDWDVLANWDADALIAGGFDEAMLDALNRDAAALAKLLESAVADVADEPPDAPDAQVDRAEELRAAWGVEPGQLWRIPSRSVPGGEHRIICGDSTDVDVVARLMQGERAQMALADPPYGIGIDFGEAAGEDTRENTQRLAGAVIPIVMSNADMLFWVSGGINLLRWYYVNMPPNWIIAWYKGSPGHLSFVGFNDWEAILVYGKRQGVSMHDYLDVRPSEKMGNYGHPTPKPVDWAEWFIERASDVGGGVLDPFLGSGTTLVACERLGRLGRGVEIEPKYVAVALQRLADMGLEPELVSEFAE